MTVVTRVGLFLNRPIALLEGAGEGESTASDITRDTLLISHSTTDSKDVISKDTLREEYRAEQAKLLQAVENFAAHGQYLLRYLTKDVEQKWSHSERISMALDIRGIWGIPTKTAFRTNLYGMITHIEYEFSEGVVVDEGVVSILRDAD